MDNPFAATIAAAAKAQPSVPNAPKVVPGLVLHADGDYFAYSCAGNDDTPPAFCRRAVIDRLQNAQMAVGAEHVIIHLSARNTTKGERGHIATVKPYQGNREGARRPRNWQFLREYLESLPNIVLSTHREADDSIAAAAWKKPDAVAIYTADKDMRQLPGTHVEWKTYAIIRVPANTYDVRRVDADGFDVAYGTRWFWMQMLMGDTADNIPGLPQWVENGKRQLVGPVTAETLLDGIDNNEDACLRVLKGYIALYGKEAADRFVEQAALLWLRTTDDADIGDFLRIMPASRLLLDATQRMKERVNHSIQTINRITSQVGSGELADCPEW